MNLIEVESKISVLESTREDIANKANAQMAPLNNQLHQVMLAATEQLARIDGQLVILKELRGSLVPMEPVVETTSGAVSDSVP